MNTSNTLLVGESMDAQALLEQILSSGRKLAAQGAEQGSELVSKTKDMAEQGLDYATEKLNLPPAGAERDALFKNLGVGAAAGGLLALLVGTKSGRKVLSPALKLGGLAALGGLGYKVYSDWQKSQGNTIDGQPIDQLPAPDANERAITIVKAMIGAAKADGTIDASEQALITAKIESSELNADLTQTLLAELQSPLDVAAIAAGATSTEAAVEVYLASLLVTDQANHAERKYLDDLSVALKLDPNLIRNLEAEAFSPA